MGTVVSVETDMAIVDLDENDIKVIGYALEWMAEGEVIEEWEFHARIGLELEELREMLKFWPNWNDKSDDSNECLAINNVLNDLLHGVGISDGEAVKRLKVTQQELGAVYRRWVLSRGWKSTGVL